MAAAVTLVLAADDPASRRAAAALFPEAEIRALARHELRPRRPFEGELFALLARRTRGSCLGLVAPVVWCRHAGCAPPPGALLAVTDHVNLELSGPLSGRWPAGVPRSFPSLSGCYQPAVIRSRGGARVYSSGVVGGVADARRLSAFEAGAVPRAGVSGVSDTLVPAVLVAAFYDLKIAACGVLQANDDEEG